MSFSDSEEDEGIIILEAARDTANANRLDHSPPKKKRKLCRNRSSVAPKRRSRRKKTNPNTINLRQRGSNIHITQRPTNTNNANVINIISSSESDSDDHDSSSSDSNQQDTNTKKQQRQTMSSHSRTLFLQNQQRRHELLQYDSSSSSSSSSSFPFPLPTNDDAEHTLHPILPMSTQAVYHFGNKQYPNPLNINPGAIVRLELINFLCHSHFAITFHPNINIISGVNGSGKSAIEAGISMALGTSARKTTRGNTVRDVIKFNEQFAKIRLYLHNRGPEALREYGPEICIERKLSSSGKNGTSAFKVLDSKLKTIGNGMRAVRDIAERLNIHVDNPCVVLKQEAAKRFLNTSKDRDKYRFFMQASKLGDFVEVLRDSMENVETALEQQRQTKESFDAIQTQYNECKRNYDNLKSIESQEELIVLYIRSEKWMKYHKGVREVNKSRNKAETFKNKLIRGRNAWERQKLLLEKSVKRATEMKKKNESDAKRIDKYKTPLKNVKKELKSLEKRKKELSRKQSARKKLMDRSKKNIKNYKKEIDVLKEEMINNERGKRMTDINDELDECQKALESDRKKVPFLKKHSTETDEMVQKKSLLQRKRNDLETKMYRITQIEAQLKSLKSRQTSTSEVFCPRVAQRKRITIKQIRQLINRNKHRFQNVPIGPLGDYISVKAQDIITGHNIDEATQDKYIGVIQAALGDLITNFLVSTSSDQQLFRKICYQKFNLVIPCIQYAFDPKRYKISDDPFKQYKSKHGSLLRINDLFEIKDNGNSNDISSWIFNTIITSSQCELKYAYGTLSSARTFLSGLTRHELHAISCIYTYLEHKGIYKISRRGQSVSGTPVPSSAPLIGADMTRLIQHYTTILHMETHQCSMLEKEVDALEMFVEDMEMRVNEYQDQIKATQRNIHKLELRIEELIAAKADIEDDMESNEAHERIMELEHSIHDEEGMIEQHLSEIDPYKHEIMEIKEEEKKRRSKYDEIEEHIHSEEKKVSKSRSEFQKFLDKIKKEKINMEKIPDKLKGFECKIKEQLKFIEAQEREINVLLEDAQECGDQITPDQYPCKPPHLLNGRKMRVKFKLDELIEYRKQVSASIEEWKRMNNNPEEIKQRYATIKPKYEEHQEAVRKCNNNVEAMKMVLVDRRKEYKKMKACVTEQLNTEFRYVMRQQAHDGNLEVDFEKGSLALKVIMASHDRFDANEQQHHVVNSKTLSGGEKSFTQIALIMALQKFCGTPMCIYDEFDVFMDSVNRGNSIKILLKTAIKNGGDRQYIFITPHDVSPMMDRRYRDMIRIHKLDAPRPQ